MKHPKTTPSHNARPAETDAEIDRGDREISDFLDALPVSDACGTVKPLHRDSDFDSLRPVEAVEGFLDFCASVRSRYEGNAQQEENANLETQDLLHFMELSDNLGVSEGFKAYRKMREVRRVRRDAKNENELLLPVYNFLVRTDFVSQLQRVLGDLRVRQELVRKRQYGMRTDIWEREDV